MRAIFTIALNDLRLLSRDRVGVFWALAFPVTMALFFGVAFRSPGPMGGLNVILVQETTGTLARSFVSTLQTNKSLFLQTHTRPDDQGTTRPWTLDDARNMVRRGQAVAYLRLTPAFRDLRSLFGSDAPLELGTDPSRTAETGFLQGILIQSLFTAATDSLTQSPDILRTLAQDGRRDFQRSAVLLPPGQGEVFVQFFDSLDSFLTRADPDLLGLTTTKTKGTSATATSADNNTSAAKTGPALDLSSFLTVTSVDRETAGRPRSGYEVTFPSGIMWGVVGVVASFAMALVVERREGTLLRLRVAPISRTTILAGKATGCFLACLISMTAVLTLGIGGFGIRVLNAPALAAAVLCTCAAFVGIMMFISTLGQTEKAVGGGGWAILIVMMMFGGGMIPLIAMPEWMQTGSYLSPARWAVVALEGAIWRDFTPTEMLQPCSILLAVGGVSFALGLRRFRD